MIKSALLACLALSLFAAPALADRDNPPPPKDDGKGTLKPGQAVGVRKCLGSSGGVNIEATSKRTVGVATCRSALQKIFIEEKNLCAGKPKYAKVEYSWQFGEGEYATTGKHYFMCR
jgi:hypothetical protein